MRRIFGRLIGLGIAAVIIYFVFPLLSKIPSWLWYLSCGILLIGGFLYLMSVSKFVGSEEEEAFKTFKAKLSEDPKYTKEIYQEFREKVKENEFSDEAHDLGWRLYGKGIISRSLTNRMAEEIERQEREKGT